MAVLFSICALTISQEPTSKQKKKEQPTHYQGVVYDTVIAEQFPDTIHMKQSIVLDRLDSLINEKQKN